MTKTITFNELRRIKDSLPDGSMHRIADEMEPWVIEALKNAGCDTAKSVLELPVEEIATRADLEIEQAQKVVEILKAEFEE